MFQFWGCNNQWFFFFFCLKPAWWILISSYSLFQETLRRYHSSNRNITTSRQKQISSYQIFDCSTTSTKNSLPCECTIWLASFTRRYIPPYLRGNTHYVLFSLYFWSVKHNWFLWLFIQGMKIKLFIKYQTQPLPNHTKAGLITNTSTVKDYRNFPLLPLPLFSKLMRFNKKTNNSMKWQPKLFNKNVPCPVGGSRM